MIINAFVLQGIQNEKTKVQVDSDRAILVDNEAAEQQVDPDKHIPFHNRYRLHKKASIYSKDGSKGKGELLCLCIAGKLRRSTRAWCVG